MGGGGGEIVSRETRRGKGGKAEKEGERGMGKGCKEIELETEGASEAMGLLLMYTSDIRIKDRVTA